ncbi:MAG: activating enzyme, partial [Candidatus Omnitrophota bacterium]
TDELKITQKDIYQLITSKAAIKTAQNILAKYYPVEIENIDKIFISGGFGNFINVKNAMRIGLIPEVDEKKVIKIGNGALEGAREMLLSGERRKLSEEIAKKVKHVKINEIEKNFEYIMAENMYFE